MSDPRDLRRIVTEIRSALDGHPREALVEILTYVFKEYVVEGSTPLASGAGAILDARSELDGMTFAQVVIWLQSHLDHPELRLFEVAGDKVSVRVAGRPVALEVQQQPEPLPPPRASVAAPSANEAAPTLQVGARPMPVTQTPPVGTAPRAPGSPAQSGAANPNAPAAALNAPAQPGAPSVPGQNPANAATQQKEEPEPSSRFSLLEVD